MDRDPDAREYRFVPDNATLLQTLEEYVEEYNLTANSNTKLVFFRDAIRHLARISRVLQQPRGNAVLVGVGGSGRQCLTRLAAFVSNCQCIQPEISRSYGKNEFREDVKKTLLSAGCGGKHVVFLLSDNQIVREDFLEDINCVLNTGEVPNIFAVEDYEQIMDAVTPLARAAGKMESKDVVYAHFVELVREVLSFFFIDCPSYFSFLPPSASPHCLGYESHRRSVPSSYSYVPCACQQLHN